MSPKPARSRSLDIAHTPKSLGKHTERDNVCYNFSLNPTQTRSGREILLEVLRTDRAAIETRFWVQVKKTPNCWLWTGATNGRLHHGAFLFKVGARWNRAAAHRVSWLLTGESIPDGMVICHRCDNPPCVNPNHLFVGTQGDNLRDASSKGRLRAPRDRALTLSDRLAIYYAPRDRRTGAMLARQYGVSKVIVSQCRSGRFVGSPENPAHPLSSKHIAALNQQRLNAVFEHVPSVQLPIRGEVA